MDKFYSNKMQQANRSNGEHMGRKANHVQYNKKKDDGRYSDLNDVEKCVKNRKHSNDVNNSSPLTLKKSTGNSCRNQKPYPRCYKLSIQSNHHSNGLVDRWMDGYPRKRADQQVSGA